MNQDPSAWVEGQRPESWAEKKPLPWIRVSARVEKWRSPIWRVIIGAGATGVGLAALGDGGVVVEDMVGGEWRSPGGNNIDISGWAFQDSYSSRLPTPEASL